MLLAACGRTPVGENRRSILNGLEVSSGQSRHFYHGLLGSLSNTLKRPKSAAQYRKSCVTSSEPLMAVRIIFERLSICRSLSHFQLISKTNTHLSWPFRKH